MKYILIFNLILLCYSYQVSADAISFARGQSTSIDKSNIKKYAYILETNYNIPILREYQLTLDIDFSGHFWQNLYGPDITAASAVPLIKYKIETPLGILVSRVGIGIAYVDQVRWGNRDLGDNWMFEDKLEIGIEITHKHRIALLLQHFSNAGLNKSNDGTNLLSLNYSYHW